MHSPWFTRGFARRALRRIVPALLLGLVAGLGHAQSVDEGGDPGDPPDRVARLAYLAGDVGFLPAGAQEWSDAGVNRPLTRGDRLATGHDARVELELDRASLRADRDTDLDLLQLDDQIGQIELTRGTLNLSVRGLDPGESYEIDTPTVALVLDHPGVFRIDVDDRGGDTEITALDGQATVYGENGASRLLVGGHSYRFDDSSLAQVGESYSGARDAFDIWCADRDDRYARSTTRQYVSEEVVGYEDLDQYGQWQSSDDYGQVWYPAYVANDWAPYRQGHWAYVAPWGWTWVDDAPWGFAPYHYGRWVSVRGRWGWIPGPRDLRPIYAPALVAFVGGSGWNVSIGSGAPIGWFPLGPGDIYNPWYSASAGYYRRVNRHNIRWGRAHHRGDHDGDHDGDRRIDEHYRHYREGRDPDQHYANRYAPHGITAMSREAFVHAERASAHRVNVDPARLREAPVLARGNGVQPVHASIAGVRPGHARHVPTGRFDRAVVAHRTPPGLAVREHRQDAMTTQARSNASVSGSAGASRFPVARHAGDAAAQARDARGEAFRSARFAHPGAGSSRGTETAETSPRRERSTARPGTLPTVPRFVRPTQAAAVQPTRSTTYRPPRESARPATLPTPARIEPAGRVARGGWRSNDPSPRIMHAPVERARASEPMRRYEPRHEASRGYESRPAPAPVFRRETPAATPQRREAPVARPFTPAPQQSAPRQSSPARRAQGNDGAAPATLHYKHR